jgi:hypothetical protein
MYFAMVAAFMVILPVASIIAETSISPGLSLVFLVGKWFVFWAVGMRLFTAGSRQILQPDFTAKTIFEIEDPGATKIVSELGIGNAAIGAISLASIHFQGWIMPMAIYGLIFYGLAGVRHLGNRRRNGLRWSRPCQISGSPGCLRLTSSAPSWLEKALAVGAQHVWRATTRCVSGEAVAGLIRASTWPAREVGHGDHRAFSRACARTSDGTRPYRCRNK